MALKHVMINDIISEHSARMQNLKKYYPFFVLNETTFSQYKEGKYGFLDMGYITMASLRFLINENNFHEKDITYEEYESFMSELLHRDFNLDEPKDEEKQLILHIFDKLKNDGRAFEFKFYNPDTKSSQIARVKLIDSRIENGQVLYTITAEGIEFYLDTKEVKDESKINVSQLLLEKMITSNNFKGGIDVVKRINAQVTKLKAEKENVLKLLGMDIFEGNKAYTEYMDTIAKWFSEEQKLFAKNKALVDKAIKKAEFENNQSVDSSQGITDGQPPAKLLRSKALEEISSLENELKKTIYNHSQLIAETVELSQLADKIIGQAKLRKLRPVFDFRQSLVNIMKQDNPALMAHVIMPLFAPRIEKTFSIKSIDNMLTLKSEEKATGEKVEKASLDLDFKYEDEILDEKISHNFAMLFVQLLDQLKKWNKLSLKEYNGILEIKFTKDIYENRDYYAFLVHLAGKREYSMKQMLLKQDTMLEEMVISHMTEEEKSEYGDMEFVLSFGADEIELGALGDNAQEMTSDRFVVTDMYFERRLG
ncbi:MAG: hypothetical protein E7263_06965 [Lachnospiraceae bacterium]|nr:hypothetical protein [Lachnospiraceae bacterium]